MANLVKTYDGMELFAKRTECDRNGVNLTVGLEGTLDVLLDENNDPVVDMSGNVVQSNESTALVKAFGGIELKAARAVRDENGNDIADTYVTKDELATELAKLEAKLSGGGH